MTSMIDDEILKASVTKKNVCGKKNSKSSEEHKSGFFWAGTSHIIFRPFSKH